jgi:hypothetical protein
VLLGFKSLHHELSSYFFSLETAENVSSMFWDSFDKLEARVGRWKWNLVAMTLRTLRTKK